MKCKKLHLFTGSGATYTFTDVEILSVNETTISFDYTAASDGAQKHGVFFFKNIAGYSYLLAVE